MLRSLSMPGKRVLFDDETLHALDGLARDRMMDFRNSPMKPLVIC
jgi:hypothetical protein